MISMTDKLHEMKKLVIDGLAGTFDSGDIKELSKEFGISEENVQMLTRKLLDKWLSDPESIVTMASMLGISLPRTSKERPARYIG